MMEKEKFVRRIKNKANAATLNLFDSSDGDQSKTISAEKKKLSVDYIPIEKIKPLTNITYLDSYIITATIPAGYASGTYNLHITNPDGGYTLLNNAFTVYHLP